jgi:HTH-type transcriptional regulator / antitoxin HigA
MSRTKTRMDFAQVPTNYPELVRAYPPRTIHDSVDYDNFGEILDVLAVNADRLNQDQRDFLDTLTLLIEEYDRAQGPLCSARLRGLKALKFLLEQNNMTGSDLGRILGHRTLGSAILRGERRLNVAHMLKLAARFKVDASLFLESA